MSLTSSGVGAQTTSSLTGPQPNVFLGPLLSYPTATGTTPTNDGTKLSFASASSQFLNFGSQTFDMTKGFSVTCKFAFTGTAGTDEVILNFDSIRLTRSGTTGSIIFTYYNGATAYSVTSTNTVAQGQVNTVTVFYTHSPVSLSIILNGVTTTSTPAVAATTPRTITNSYVGFTTDIGQNLFVAVSGGQQSDAATSSTDGINWTPRTLPSVSFWSSVTVNSNTGVFVAVASSSNSAASSTDGINWTPRTLPSSSGWISVTVNPTTGIFVAISTSIGSSAGTTTAAYSTDGFTWSPAVLPSMSEWQSVTVNPTTGVFVAVARLTNGAATNVAASSTDGINWTPRTLSSASFWVSVTCNRTTGIFVAIAGASTVAASSTNGINWTPRTLPYSLFWTSVTVNPTTGVFVAVASNTIAAASSADGFNWSERSLSTFQNWKSVTVNPTTGIFVAVNSVSAVAASSTNGINWTQRSLPANSGNDSTWQSVTASTPVSGGAYLNGDIYSLNIYNRELTPNEVTGPPAPSPWGIFTASLPEIGSTPNSTFTDVTGTTIGLSWVENVPIYTTSYRVYAYNAGSLTLVGFQNAASSPYIYTGLQTNSGYYFKIAGVNTVGVGPQSAASVSAYTNIPYTGSSGTINVSPGTYRIRLAGGVGGGGGSGRLIEANFTIDATISMKYVIGGAGAASGFGGAGGGATYMYDLTNSRALFVAGAGGGGNAGSTANPGTGSGGSYAGYAGAGGGLFGDGGTSGGQSFFNGSAGGTYGNTGAFGGGGGGGSSYSGGGGGGYTGGNGAGVFSAGGGGGGTSYAITGSTVLTDSATNTSNGYINMKPRLINIVSPDFQLNTTSANSFSVSQSTDPLVTGTITWTYSTLPPGVSFTSSTDTTITFGVAAGTLIIPQPFTVTATSANFPLEPSSVTFTLAASTSSIPGTSQYYPATNAVEILAADPAATDGVYWINCNGVATEIYCIMNSLYNGGGWMLLMKGPQGTTFQYSSTYWTDNTSTLNTANTNLTNNDAKFAAFNSVTINDVMAWWPDVGITGGSIPSTPYWTWHVNNWYSTNFPMMTADTTVISGQTYIASASSYYDSNYLPWRAFDYSTSTAWHIQGGGGRYSGGAYIGGLTTTVSGVSRAGEWLQLQYPSSVTITSYEIQQRDGQNSTAPVAWWIAGSTNGSTWTLIDTRSGITYQNANLQTNTFLPATPGTYSYYRIIINAVNGASDCSMAAFNIRTTATNTRLTAFDGMSSGNSRNAPGVSDPNTWAGNSTSIWSRQSSVWRHVIGGPSVVGGNHSVRWGFLYNEAGDGFNSIDVTGGIGLSQTARSAGDIIGCCQSSTGLNRAMSFLFFGR